MEARPGGIQLRPEPSPDQGYAEPYGVAAFTLRDALTAAANVVPELRLEGLDEVAAEIATLATS
jgi:hypothetical protein